MGRPNPSVRECLRCDNAPEAYSDLCAKCAVPIEPKKLVGLEVNGPANIVMLIDAMMAPTSNGGTFKEFFPELEGFMLKVRKEAVRTIEYMKAVKAVDVTPWHEINTNKGIKP